MGKKLSEHFTLEELTASAKAKALKIDNTPTAVAEKNLEQLCKQILEPIRAKYGHSIFVNSGYRCPALNKAVGGSKTSQHMTGEAVDIRCEATSKEVLFHMILSMVKSGKLYVGQLIWEYGTINEPKWIHVSLPRVGKKNNQILYYYSK